MSTTLNTNPLFIQGSVTGYKAQTATALGTLRTLERAAHTLAESRYVQNAFDRRSCIGNHPRTIHQ